MKIFDLHCDTLTECHKRHLSLRNSRTQLSLDRMGRGEWRQAMAVFMPDFLRGVWADVYFDMVCRFWRRELVRHGGLVRVVDDLSSEISGDKIELFLTVEGGSVLRGKEERIPLLARRGVRMLTLTWNGKNELGGGCLEDIGLTDFGRRAVPILEQNNIIIDISHLGDKGFWEVAELAKRPFLASHSNSRTIHDHPRNLTDRQFLAIVEAGGIVGLNFYIEFLGRGETVHMPKTLMAHINHFVALGGENHIALGSDYDGAELAFYINRSEKLEKAVQTMVKSGLDYTLAEKICHKNAEDFFRRYKNSAHGGVDNEILQHKG